MSIYLKSKNQYEVRADGDIEPLNKLPAGVYYIEQDVNTEQFYLVKKSQFVLPEKIYGSQIKRAERIVNTFMDRTSNTGVLLSGNKGSGKTLLAEQVSDLLIQKGVPTLVVSHQYPTDRLGDFLKDISDRCCIILDEFEKLFTEDEYYSNSQAGLLTLFDGLVQGNKLFIMTTNDMENINQNLQNRPGRVYYSYEFHGAENDVIDQYCADHLVNKQWVVQVKRIKAMLDSSFSFDVLKAIVEESNRYGEEPFECIKILNVVPETQNSAYTCKVYKNGKPFKSGPRGNELESVVSLEESDVNITSEFYLEMRVWNKSMEDWDWDRFKLTPKDLRSKSEDTITYELEGLTFVFEREKNNNAHWSSPLR